MSGLEALRQAQKLVARLSVAGGGSPDRVHEVLSLLVVAERELATLSAGSHVGRVLNKGGSVTYFVEKLDGRMVLTERRVGTIAHPVRCPQNVYEAVATVLARAEHTLAVEQIINRIEAGNGFEPAAFQVRLAIRCWMSVTPPLVERLRAKYRPVQRPVFSKQAKRLWRDLSDHSPGR